SRRSPARAETRRAGLRAFRPECPRLSPMATGESSKQTVSRSQGRRIALTALVIVVWLVVLAVGGRMFSQLNELGTNDRVQFLPASAESTEVDHVQAAFRAEGYSSAVEVFTFDQPLSERDGALMKRAVELLPPIDGVSLFRSTPFVISDDGLAAVTVIPVESAGAVDDSVDQLRAALATAIPAATGVYITGGAGF